jgi:hypothetical protein
MSASAPPRPAAQPGVYDTRARSEEKAALRARDAAALACGEKSPEELRVERATFAFPHVRIDLDSVIAFE